MTVIALIIAFTGLKFMPSSEQDAELGQTQMFNYFTVQSNTFMGIVSLIFAIQEICVLKGIKKEITSKYYILKMIATVAVSLTFLVAFTYFSFMLKCGIIALVRDSNLFFHFIIPVTSIINYIFFEKTDIIRFKHTYYGLLPTGLYEIYYIINILSNIENGKVSPTYDWYYFVQHGVSMAIIVAPLMLFITYIITFIIWRLNKIKK